MFHLPLIYNAYRGTLKMTHRFWFYIHLFNFKDRLRPGEYIPPKKMIEFSRKHQEDKLVKEQEDELRQLTEDEVDLEVNIRWLWWNAIVCRIYVAS